MRTIELDPPVDAGPASPGMAEACEGLDAVRRVHEWAGKEILAWLYREADIYEQRMLAALPFGYGVLEFPTRTLPDRMFQLAALPERSIVAGDDVMVDAGHFEREAVCGC